MIRKELYKIRKQLAKSNLIDCTVKKLYMFIKKNYQQYCSIKELNLIKQNHSKNQKKIWYLDIPIHSNMGDLAQYVCIKDWLKKNYYDYEIIELSALVIVNCENQFLELMKNHCGKEDLIFFQSGYCTQDLGGTHNYVHELVVKNFRTTPIIMLPQTILYKDKKNEEKTAQIYAQHKKLLIMCRDSVSYEMAQKIFPYNQKLQYPDIVTSLIGTKDINNKDNRRGILLCCRNDIEKYYSDDDIYTLKNQFDKIDEVSIDDTSIDCDFGYLKNDIQKYIQEMFDKFGQYRVIVTDRYHGTIFSLISGTPVIVIKTNDHKVITGVDWFKNVYDETVFYLSEINDVYDKVKFLYSNYKYKKLESWFEVEYYSNLKKKIDNWLKNIEEVKY